MVLVRPFLLTARRGARTSVYLASSPEVANVTGQYFVRRKPRPLTSVGGDPAAAQRLWQASEELLVEAGASQ